MLLSQLLKKIDYSECINFREHEISDITENSKSVRQGFVFACIKGAVFDAKDYLPEAKESGAEVFVAEEIYSDLEGETVIISKNPRKTSAEIANAIYGSNLDKMKIIGITGTKGKTTTAKILSECIAYLDISVVSIGTLGVEFYNDGKRFLISGKTENTTPDAPFIYKALMDAYNTGVRVGIIEVSSQALTNFRVYGIPFTVCIFTNFSPDHIGAFEHNSTEEYLKAKRSLFCNYGSKICIVNSDDSEASYISGGIEHVIGIGESSEKYKLELIESSNTASSFLINDEEFSLSLGGAFNAANSALAIVAASLLFGRDISCFKNVLKNLNIPGRYETYDLGGKTVIIDFAHNKDSFESVFSSVRQVCSGKIIAVFGSVGSRSKKRREDLASAAEEMTDFSVITSDNPGCEPAEKICGEIYSHFIDKSKAKIVADREEAIIFALDYADIGDAVLLLGKGHEEYQCINGEKIPFSERKIIESMGAVRVCK